MDLMMQHLKSNPEDVSMEDNLTVLEFVRHQLNKYTTCSSEKGKFKNRSGSEERDYLFGKLFGILAVLRSGTLVVADVTSPINVGLVDFGSWP